MAEGRKVEFFALSTCGWCTKTKEWLEERRVDYDVIYMDMAETDERDEAKQRMKQFTEKIAFPLMIVDDGAEVIQGCKPDKFEEVFG